jgi:NADPH2:quinone reductase
MGTTRWHRREMPQLVELRAAIGQMEHIEERRSGAGAAWSAISPSTRRRVNGPGRNCGRLRSSSRSRRMLWLRGDLASNARSASRAHPALLERGGLHPSEQLFSLKLSAPRTGLYPAALPSGLGTEAAGIVEDVGPGVDHIKAGDRVAYAGGPLGAYSEVRVMPADRLVALPQGISDQQAAEMMLKGLTVQYLIRQIHKVAKGDTILFHAAAGGVGLIACQWAKSLGATVIGTVGNEEKAKIAKAHGCDYPVIYTREDFVARVKEITRDQKLPVVYDSVGKDTFMKSLDCLKPKGMMVSFGQSSGSVGPIDLGIFGQKGSLFFTRPTLNTYAAARADLSAMAKDLFGVVLSGAVKIEIKQTYPLKDAAQAHRDLESRKTMGSTVLTV